MSEKISRRNFLRTATLGAAAAGLLAGRHPRHRDHDIQR